MIGKEEMLDVVGWMNICPNIGVVRRAFKYTGVSMTMDQYLSYEHSSTSRSSTELFSIPLPS
jgi:hypothetical protein